MSLSASPGRLRALGALGYVRSGYGAALALIEFDHCLLDLRQELFFFLLRIRFLFLFFAPALLFEASLGPLLELLRYFAIRHARPQRGAVDYCSEESTHSH